jgi:hypothetical protein
MASIAAFFEAYATAHLSFDAEALTPFFHLPCLIVDNEGDHVMAEERDLLDYERAFLARLRDDGLHGVAAAPLSDMPFGRDAVVCAVHYHLEGREHAALNDFTCHYVLVRIKRDWRIKLAKSGRIEGG